MFKKILKAALSHKIISAIVIILVAVGIYYGYKSLKEGTNQTTYVLAAVEKGMLIKSVSGSGQVSASNQVDIKAKASADITYLGVSVGQEVKTGTLLAQMDSKDAQNAVRDAQASLENAKLSMEKLQQSSDVLSLLQAQNSLAQAEESKKNAQYSLEKSYDDGFNTVSSAFLELPSIMAGLTDIILDNDLSIGQQNLDFYADVTYIFNEKAIQYRDQTYNSYNISRAAYDKNFADYKSTSRFSDENTTEFLINETYNTTKEIAETIKNINNLIQLYKDELTQKDMNPLAMTETHLSNLSSYTQKVNNQISSLLSIKNTIQNSKQTLVSAERTIAERIQSLANLREGPDDIDVRTQQLTIQQREDALLKAKKNLVDYSVRAPFDGVIANINVKKWDSVNSGTIIATLITKQQIAEISLNEVDAANVKVGQKTTLTFDAVEDLSISGQVVEIDTLGIVSQGVVSYNVTIGFDTQDERIKPGMSVSASIINDAKLDVLLVPNSAIKTSSGASYVQVINGLDSQTSGASILQSAIPSGSPNQVIVQTGLSNDTSTEISSGLKEGDMVVTKTTTTSASKSSSSSFNLFGLFGGSQSRQTSSSQTTKSSTSNSSGATQSSGGSVNVEMRTPPGF
ncbi:MAG: hypothetical protein A2Y98_03005 [Candidatus Portnoybacteria bacterium RBG_19FT_COMBO_36_7]|uniref:Uncharacterized protein n=1 Tax=Candidatus Portnoybacteria bacterium RBG_19FT_COMBO_36_7 TaxID=1801992 RepID=A0A1G2F779_9BACT|nr:MAG: hypothetical protein A2Y98_03005 [Candidatus Portnoybacteria bacterium RBG_19FT_COMBO_36_7]